MIEGVASSAGMVPAGDAWAELIRLLDLQPSADVPAVAAALQRPQGDAEVETTLAGSLRTLVQEPPFGRELDVSRLVATLGARGLAPLVRHFAGDVFARRRFLLAAGRNLQPDSAARLVLAAAVAWDRPCSRPFMEVLAKLTKAAVAGDAGCVVAIQDLTRLVADRWGDISADASSYTYEDMVSAEQQQTGHHPQAFPEADRLVELAAEVDALTGETWKAVSELLDRNRTPELLAMLRRAPKESQAARGIVQHVATPARLKSLLEEQPIDYEAVDHLVPALGMGAAEVLLDRLALAQSREERHPLVERLSALGPSIAPMVLTRLEDERWFVVANMLAVLRSWKLSAADVSLQKHAAHPDARVRREALQLLLESDPARRDEAIVLGLRDNDQQNVHLALQAARGACPSGAVNALAALIGAPTTPAFLRIPAIRLLADIGNAAALDILLRVVDAGSSLMGKRKLAPKTPEVLAALSALRSYRGDRRAAELLAAAEASRDDELRLAATVGT